MEKHVDALEQELQVGDPVAFCYSYDKNANFSYGLIESLADKMVNIAVSDIHSRMTRKLKTQVILINHKKLPKLYDFDNTTITNKDYIAKGKIINKKIQKTIDIYEERYKRFRK